VRVQAAPCQGGKEGAEHQARWSIEGRCAGPDELALRHAGTSGPPTTRARHARATPPGYRMPALGLAALAAYRRRLKGR
jgi:hypothetical protein